MRARLSEDLWIQKESKGTDYTHEEVWTAGLQEPESTGPCPTLVHIPPPPASCVRLTRDEPRQHFEGVLWFSTQDENLSVFL